MCAAKLAVVRREDNHCIGEGRFLGGRERRGFGAVPQECRHLAQDRAVRVGRVAVANNLRVRRRQAADELICARGEPVINVQIQAPIPVRIRSAL